MNVSIIFIKLIGWPPYSLEKALHTGHIVSYPVDGIARSMWSGSKFKLNFLSSDPAIVNFVHVWLFVTPPCISCMLKSYCRNNFRGPQFILLTYPAILCIYKKLSLSISRSRASYNFRMVSHRESCQVCLLLMHLCTCCCMKRISQLSAKSGANALYIPLCRVFLSLGGQVVRQCPSDQILTVNKQNIFLPKATFWA